jgi:hypothetical protein
LTKKKKKKRKLLHSFLSRSLERRRDIISDEALVCAPEGNDAAAFAEEQFVISRMLLRSAG